MKKAFFIGLFSLLSILSARAYDFEVDGIYYNTLLGTTGEVAVTSEGPDDGRYSGSVVIPATITYNGDTYTVTSIGENAFAGCSGLTSVTIPEGVTYIGDGAFYECSGLTSVTIPEGVTYIGLVAFRGCSGLTSVVIPKGVTYIGNSAFSDCSGLTSVVIPNSVTSIETGAFWRCSSLTSVYYTGNIAQWCGINFGNWMSDITWNLYMDSVKVTDLLIIDGITSIGDWAFYSCSSLTSITISESVTSIGEAAFLGCTRLATVKIQEGVASIGDGAFEECSSLTSVTIPESVTSIGIWAFGNCSGLTSVTIPESVTSIGKWAFYECSGLTSVAWNARHCQDFDYRQYNSHPFFGCENITFITFGSEVEYIPAHLCSGKDKLTSVTIPESVTSIGESAFSYCSSLMTTTISEGVDSIGAYAFYGCSSLATVSIPESVTYIGEKAFDGIAIGSPLHNTTVFAKMPEDYSGGYAIPDGIQTIADGAFSGCSGLTFLAKIPESVIAIGAQAFYGCSGLKSVTLPVSLDTIGKYAFAFCDSLISVISLAANPPYCINDDGEGGAAFSVRGATFSVYETLYVPRGSKAAYQAAPVWRDFDNIEEIETTGTRLITVLVNDESMGTVVGGGAYALGEQITLEAIPNEGYHFVRWDDGNTDNPRILTVICDAEFTATFAKNEPDPTDPSEPTAPTANEQALSAAPFAYVQGRTAYLSDGLGEVEAFTATGQRVYRGTDCSVTLPRPGVYVLRVVADGRRCKVIVR